MIPGALRSLTLLLLSAALIRAEEVVVHDNFYRLSYDRITLPQDETMGLAGIGYLTTHPSGLYYGAGIYGALEGKRGGFFTGGIEFGGRLRLNRRVLFDLGAFVGGGGGGAAPQGGGLMLRPHTELLYDTGPAIFGLGYSHVIFPNGDIRSGQATVEVQFPFQTVTASAALEAGDRLFEALTRHSEQYSFGWIGRAYALTAEQYYPLNGTRDTSGRPDEEKISLVGFEYLRTFSPAWFGYLEIAGAMHGDAGGFAQLLGGLGYRHSLYRDNLALHAKAGLGSAGGGRVDTGGGLVYKTQLGLEFTPSERLGIGIDGGYIDAPDGNFQAYTLKLSAAYRLETLGVGSDVRHVDAFRHHQTGTWNLRLLNQTYLPSSKSRYNGNDDAINLVGLKIDRYLGEHFYLTGQAFGAYEGGVGGYASGLIGIGWHTAPLFGGLSFFAELLGGAGAGGGIATEGGALWQPMAGAEYRFSPDFGVQIGFGTVDALSGSLHTGVVDIGLCYRFNSIERP